MKHLQGQSHLDDFVIHPSHHPGRKQDQKRTELLAGSLEEVVDGFFEQRIVAIKRSAESLAKLFHFRRNRGLYLIKYVHFVWVSGVKVKLNRK